jgi:acetaldehyde dehydrogenase (acetylating)
MSADKVRVAFIGGGRTAKPLLEDFLRRPFIEVVGVADIDPGCPGALTAKLSQVPFTTDPIEFARRGEEIDLLIEATGDAKVKRGLKMALLAEGNRHTIIVHDLIARLMLSMSQNSSTLMETYHPDDTGVG